MEILKNTLIKNTKHEHIKINGTGVLPVQSNYKKMITIKINTNNLKIIG